MRPKSELNLHPAIPHIGSHAFLHLYITLCWKLKLHQSLNAAQDFAADECFESVVLFH